MNNLTWFFQAIENTRYLNELYYNRKWSLYQEVFIHFKLGRYIKKSFLRRICVIIFLILFPILNLVNLFETIIRICLTKHETIISKRVFLLCNTTLLRVAKFASPTFFDSWVAMPHIRKMSYPEGRVYNVYQLATIGDAFISCCLSAIATYGCLSKYGLSYTWQAIVSYKLFLYRQAILSISYDTELICCHHKDEYASMIDNLPHNNKSLIQHGCEFFRNNACKIGSPLYNYLLEYNVWTENVPHKWKSLKQIYTFSEMDYASLKSSILSCDPIVKYVDNSIELQPKLDNKRTLLIIGRYSIYGNIEKLIVETCANYDVRIIIKSHPVENPQNYKNLQTQYGVEVLCGQCFPDADLVIGYESTLLYQYQNSGKQVLTYDEIDFERLSDLFRDCE